MIANQEIIEINAFFAELKNFVKESLSHTEITFRKAELGFADDCCMLQIDRVKLKEVFYGIINKANTQSSSCGSKPRFEISVCIRFQQIQDASLKTFRLTILMSSLVLSSEDSIHHAILPAASPRGNRRKEASGGVVDENTSFRMNLFDAKRALEDMKASLLYYSPKAGDPNRAAIHLDFPLYQSNRPMRKLHRNIPQPQEQGAAGARNRVMNLSRRILSSADMALRSIFGMLCYMQYGQNKGLGADVIRSPAASSSHGDMVFENMIRRSLSSVNGCNNGNHHPTAAAGNSKSFSVISDHNNRLSSILVSCRSTRKSLKYNV
jgi:hypothetical protein